MSASPAQSAMAKPSFDAFLPPQFHPRAGSRKQQTRPTFITSQRPKSGPLPFPRSPPHPLSTPAHACLINIPAGHTIPHSDEARGGAHFDRDEAVVLHRGGGLHMHVCLLACQAVAPSSVCYASPDRI